MIAEPTSLCTNTGDVQFYILYVLLSDTMASHFLFRMQKITHRYTLLL